MEAINMMDAKRIIVEAYKRDEPLMLLGHPGMGKTSLYESCATELGLGFIDFRLPLRDPVDIGGMRVPDVKTGKLKHYVPDDLPDAKVHGSNGIILFDEINVVGQMMQAAAYGIIQERRSGSYRMAPGWVPMASGNLVSDRAAGQRLSTALANRFCVLEVKPDHRVWLDQYGSQHVDTRGTAFIRFRPELFHVMPGQTIQIGTQSMTPVPAEGVTFPSARSWTKFFKFIDVDPRLRLKIGAGYVGPSAAEEFEAFWRILEQAVTTDQIMADPTGARLPAAHDIGTQYAVASMIARTMDRKNVSALGTYLARMLPEYQVVVWADATAREPGLKKTASYGQYAVTQQHITV